MGKTIAIIGQAPSSKSNPKPPLSGRSGAKIRALFGDYWSKVEPFVKFYNVLPAFEGKNGKGDAFPMNKARLAAVGLRRKIKENILIFLGRDVGKAFGIGAPYFFVMPFDLKRGVGLRLAIVVPHPSGINIWWNESRNVVAAEIFFQRLAREVLSL